MADTKLYVQLSPELLEEAKKTVIISFNDGENEITLTEENLESLLEKDNPYSLDLSHFIPNLVPINLERFFEYLKQLLENTTDSAEQPRVVLVEEYPPLDMAKLGNEVITFKIISREPASLSADGMSRPQRSFRRKYSTQHAETGDNIIEVLSRPLDHEIELTVWATDNKLANKRVIWLENLLVSSAWVFRSQGADRFYFKKRLSDGYTTTGNQRLFYRPLRFFLRFSEFMAVANFGIKNINLEVRLSS